MPKTHKERITDIATFIPRNIPILHATISYHLHKRADDLIHLLTQDPTILTPSTPTSTRGSLLKIAMFLHWDENPGILPLINRPSSEGDKISECVQAQSFEGILYNDRFKTMLSPVVPAYLPIHPSIYTKPSV